jgi:hypothetical protein
MTGSEGHHYERRNSSQSLHHAKACRAEIGKRFGICLVSSVRSLYISVWLCCFST